MITITINRYRCFFGPQPASFTLEKGKTIAFVGKNNSGKSTILRWFYEFQSHLQIAVDSTYSSQYVGRQVESAPIQYHPAGLYGLIDTLDMYPNKISDDGINFSIKTAQIICDFSVSENANNCHFIKKSVSHLDSQVLEINSDKIFRDIIYFGPQRNLINDGSISRGYYNISVGVTFIQEWNILKNGSKTEDSNAAHKAENLIANILGWNTISINSSTDNKQLYLVRNGLRYSITELGSGISELIFCLITAAVRKPSWILIDEPESHLHPSLQTKFIEALESLASEGVIFTTHSIGLARSAADSIIAVSQNKDGSSQLRSLEAVRNYSELMGELSFSQHHELGFDRLLLCEGVTEVKTMRQILRLWDLESTTMIVPLGGTSLIDPERSDELSEFNRFGVPVFVLVDSERSSETKTDPNRVKFIELCTTLFGQGHAKQTDYRATENYFSLEAIQRVMRSDKYKPLDKFKNSKELEGQLFWGKNSNWKIAAEMTKEDWQKTDLAAFFDKIQSANPARVSQA